MTAKYLKQNGHHTSHADPQRLVWHGPCTYWTDDWTKLKSIGSGIPCCPHCKCPGYQTTYQNWIDSVKNFELEHPRYSEYIELTKETCFGRGGGINFLSKYEQWLKNVNQSNEPSEN